MFEELLFMIGFTIISISISYILLEYIPEPLNKLVKGLAIIGIVIHELCHIVMCIITNTKIHSVSLIQRVHEPDVKHHPGFGGRVTIGNSENLAFLQALLIALAPIYLSFWLFFFLLEQLLYRNLDVLIFFIIVFVMISIILGASPSIADICNIPKALNRDPIYSIYQIFLLILSGATVWLIMTLYNINVIHELFYYVFIFVGYYGFKYGLSGLHEMYYSLSKSPKKIKSRNLTRRRLKPKKPRKIKY
ncbi:MAG: hypothetical protein ACFFDL_15730 [Promethearchaeota archaeon]